MLVATARLEHFAVVTYEADLAALRRLLPSGVDVDLPLVSAVAYRYEHLGLRALPWPRLAAAQVHLRAYVTVAGESGVWFLRTVQDSRWATLPRRLWAMPWQRGPVAIDEADGELSVRADGIELLLGPPAGEAPTAGVPDQVVAATAGWFQGRAGVMRFDVGYDAGDIVGAGASGAGVGPFVALGLVAAGQPAHSAFTRPSFPIDIHLPPQRVA